MSLKNKIHIKTKGISKCNLVIFFCSVYVSTIFKLSKSMCCMVVDENLILSGCIYD